MGRVCSAVGRENGGGGGEGYGLSINSAVGRQEGEGR